MGDIKIIQLSLGPFAVNTYIVICKKSGKAAIVDPAGAPDTIINTLQQEKATALLILNTHGHPDHLLANAALKKALCIPVWMHGEDNGFFSDSPEIAPLEEQTGLRVDTAADRLLTDEETIPLGESKFRILHTPGHTPGSCCFLIEGNLMTGDTLFVGDAGRTDLKGGSLERLIQSIKTKLLPLPGDTRVWPGHDYGDRSTSTLREEKKENPYITDFILDV
jgi:glyoxylase-like metal-dependent hydrolase (beta-lactamase superfamily II)